ncbi:cilia- and flagella-associated protein 221 [Oncorhynchus mykiss]|uniref:Cep192-like domain-containing protein n=1 Tax=Oncorhynchus mykiss TaxID=8022 RepID=A0A8C7V2H0_ONCMY|nr:cilia- and flagella-associated protein 221 [Oncorhynchus mykiss]
MEVAHTASETFTDSQRKKTPLPLCRLVEDRKRSPSNVPHHLLETQTYTKLKSNSAIEAEPSALHFSGFKLGKDYHRSLKLINISSEVINVHIIPTQTKHFKTKYLKKHRLVPGLSYTVKVHFCPDEWRYFYDCIRIHCKGEENLQVPVHAYPIIDDLHIPTHITIPAVPLGQSVSHVIPLSCSCPIDFEFQVHIIQPHKAFSVQPLSGVIPANGKVEVTVTFRPFQYDTSQVTLQVVISQFNSKPYVCTLSGSSSPRLALSQQEKDMGHAREVLFIDSRGPPPVSLIQPLTKTKQRSMRTPEKSKTVRERRESDVKLSLKTAVDVSTPAGVVKILIQQTDKLSSKELREAMMSQPKLGLQTRQMKEAFFETRVQQDIQEERANHLRWQVHLGKDPVSTQTKMQVLEERDVADYEYMVRKGEVRKERDFARGQPKLSTRRVLRNTGQAPVGTPSFRMYSSSHLEIRQRALRLFQQAARKVVIQCRVNNRLVSLRRLTRSLKRLSTGVRVEEETFHLPKISPDSVIPFTFPIFSLPNQSDELAPNALGAVPVRPIEVLVKRHTPFFNLKVPQHYKLMGYQPVSAFEAAASYIPPTQPRTLCTGAQDELLPRVIRSPSGCAVAKPEGEEDVEQEDECPSLSFTAPTALLKPPYAHPLRIFNPAPGLHAFKADPLYLECDLEFHLCPLPRYTIPKPSVFGMHTPSTQKKFLDRTDVIRGVMTWKKFPSAALAALSNTPTLTSSWAPRVSDPFNSDILPTLAPTALNGLPEDMTEELLDGQSESTGVSLTPEMIRAEFPLPENVPSTPRQLKDDSFKDDSSSLSPCKTPQMMPLSTANISRESREQQLEMFLKSQTNRLGAKVMARLNHLNIVGKANSPSTPENK